MSERGGVLRAGGISLAAIVALGAALRFATLGTQSFSDDELFTAWLVTMPFTDMVSTVPESEATPHLFYLLEWLAGRVFGTGEVGMRILPALTGTLTIPVVYAAGAFAASRRAGLASALFVAVNPFLVWYSQEARAYALLILFAALSLMWFLSFRSSRRTRALAGWAVASVAALATHYFAIFLIAPEAAWLLLTGRAAPARRVAAVAAPASVAVTLVPLALYQREAVGEPGGIGDKSLPERLLAVPKNFLVGFAVPAEAVLTVAAGMAALIAGVVAVRVRGPQKGGVTLVAVVAAFAIALPALLAIGGLDYLSSRNLVAAILPIAIVLGCGFASRRAGAAALAVLCAVSLVAVAGVAAETRYQRRDWRGAAAALAPAPGGRVVVFSPAFRHPGPFRVYFAGDSRLLAAEPVQVSEVALLSLAEFDGFGPGAPSVPKATAPPPPAGFELVEDRRTDGYRLVRYRAGRRVRVSAADVRALAFPGVRATLVWQPADPRRVP